MVSSQYTNADYQQAAQIVLDATPLRPTIGLVLGSGLGKLADTLSDRTVISYDAIPGWPQSTVHGHSGNLVIGKLEGKVVIAQQGRAHFYEGYSMQQITFPIRVMQAVGIDTLILTNAAGGIDQHFNVGELMLINDHINFVGMAGNNPLIGSNDDSLGPRFVGMAQAYDRHLRDLAQSVATRHDIPLHQGVYAALSGPTFETPAEIRALRVLGANAVGMSTVHEVVVARHMGLRVMACSGITNTTIDQIDGDVETNHEEVLEAGLVIVPRLTALIQGVVREI